MQHIVYNSSKMISRRVFHMSITEMINMGKNSNKVRSNTTNNTYS